MLGAILGAAASIGSAFLGKKSAEQAGEKNAALQKEFAQNSIQWKAEDSRKAGIHPLYGLGAQTITPQASYVGDVALPNALAQVGQNIGSSIDQTRTASQKVSAYTGTAQALELERAGLQNELLRTQVAEAKARTIGSPPFPAATNEHVIPGQGNSPLVKLTPQERIASAHGHAYSEPGNVSSTGWEVDDRGTLYPVPSKDLKERTEDSPYEIEHWIRNRLGPFIRYHKGMEGRWWNPLTGGYERR